MGSERESRNQKKKKKMKERKHTKELTKLNDVLNQKEDESKSKPVEKKGKREKKSNHNAGREIQISEEGMSNVKEETGKNRSVDKKKRKREKEINLQTEFRISNEVENDKSIDKSETTKKKKLSQKKRKSQKKNDPQIDKHKQHEDKAEDGAQEQNDVLMGKSKGTKKKRKRVHTTNKGDLSQKEIDVTHKDDDVYHISSGDTDASAGMKKWLMEYHQSRLPLPVLQQKVDEFIISHDARLEQEKKEREAQSAEEGWTLVEHHKGRKKTTDSVTGTTVGSAARAAVEEKMTKKKNKDFGLDFYRFQKRDERRNELLNLQSKFEQDKKRIQQLRAARKFRPY